MTASVLWAAAFLLLMAAIYILSEQAELLRFFYSGAASVFSIGGFLAAVLGLGLNVWSRTSVVFLSLLAFFLLTLGLKCLHALAHQVRPLGASIVHLGLFLFVFSLTFGSFSYESYRLLAQPNMPESRALRIETGEVTTLPVAVELLSFDIRYHETDLKHLELAVPRQYKAKVKVYSVGDNGAAVKHEGVVDSILVNHPIRVAGFHIYNTSFDPYGQGYVEFLLVKDPWQWATYAGLLLCMLGGVVLFIEKSRGERTPADKIKKDDRVA